MGNGTEEKNDYTLYSLIKENKGMFAAIIGLFLLFFVLLLSFAVDISWNSIPSTKLERLGQLGDSFNVLTSLFTGLAFAGLVASMLLQQKELKQNGKVLTQNADLLVLQKDELAETRATLVHQKDEFIKMNELQRSLQFKHDIERDLNSIKLSIDRFEILLDFDALNKLNTSIVNNYNPATFTNYLHDSILLFSTVNDHIIIYCQRYKDDKNASYAKEELFKILHYKRFDAVLINTKSVYKTVKIGKNKLSDQNLKHFNYFINQLDDVLNGDLVDYLSNNNTSFVLKDEIKEMFKNK